MTPISKDELQARIRQCLYALDKSAYEAGQIAKAHANGRIAKAEKELTALITQQNLQLLERLKGLASTTGVIGMDGIRVDVTGVPLEVITSLEKEIRG